MIRFMTDTIKCAACRGTGSIEREAIGNERFGCAASEQPSRLPTLIYSECKACKGTGKATGEPAPVAAAPMPAVSPLSAARARDLWRGYAAAVALEARAITQDVRKAAAAAANNAINDADGEGLSAYFDARHQVGAVLAMGAARKMREIGLVAKVADPLWTLGVADELRAAVADAT